jgi:hypothetical protein
MTDGKRMIVHVFIGESSISLMVIENIIKHSACDNFFIVTKKADAQKYRELFKKYRTGNFVLCDEVKPSFLSKAITRVSSVIFGRLSPLFTYFPYDEIRTIFRYRKNPILLHGISFSFIAHLLLLNHFQSFSHVCWGYVPKPSGKNIKSKLLFLLRRSLFRGYKRIGCLMTEDKTDFETLYGITVATTIPYQSDILNYNDPQVLQIQPVPGRRKVILGNSACYTDSYLKLLPVLERIAAPASITCMLSYPDNDTTGGKKEVIEKFTFAFGGEFTPWTQQLDMENYAEKMKQHDIYICNVDRQTGLFAIYIMLMYGKKLYLTGKNLAWIRENNFIVHDVNQLETETSETFQTLLGLEERKHNHERILDMLSPAALANEWDIFYLQL